MAKLTFGEELASQEHELIHNSLHLLIKRTYIKVIFNEGDVRYCKPSELNGVTAGAKDYKTEEVQMTEAEFKALR